MSARMSVAGPQVVGGSERDRASAPDPLPWPCSCPGRARDREPDPDRGLCAARRARRLSFHIACSSFSVPHWLAEHAARPRIRRARLPYFQAHGHAQGRGHERGQGRKARARGNGQGLRRGGDGQVRSANVRPKHSASTADCADNRKERPDPTDRRQAARYRSAEGVGASSWQIERLLDRPAVSLPECPGPRGRDCREDFAQGAGWDSRRRGLTLSPSLHSAASTSGLAKLIWPLLSPPSLC